MQNIQDYKSFRISTGGLVYRFLILLRIQDPERYFIKRRIAFLLTLGWLPLLLLTTLEGNLINKSLELSFIYDLKPYVRFLVVLPLLIVADKIIDPLIASNLENIGSSGILGENRERYTKAVDQLKRRTDSFLADIVILVIIFLAVISILANLEDMDVSKDFTNWLTVQGDAEPRLTYAGWWFLLISSPVLAIVLFRWFWRFYLWAAFLFRVSRISLKLQPTHPDRAGGLGILQNGESAFVLVFFAFSALFSVSLAEEILYSDFTLVEARPVILVYIITLMIIMTLPLTFFSQQLVRAKRWGRVAYGALGYKLSRAFDEKWGDPSDPSTGNGLIKTADASAVCDYADIYEVVREMRYVLVSLRGYIAQAVVLAVPFLPLVFTEISVKEVFNQLLGMLV
jgi:hypothetical protein